MPHAAEHLLEVALAQPLFLLVEMHDGVDVERHAAAGAVVGMRGTDVDEVEVHIDDAHAEVRRRIQARHLPVGHHNHTVALAEMQLAAPVPHLTLARQAVGMGDVVFHPRLRNAVDVVVDDNISLVKFHSAKIQKNSQPKPAPELWKLQKSQCRPNRRHEKIGLHCPLHLEQVQFLVYASGIACQ